ncbi:MAG: hypothetical protein MAG794_00785 [Gammaproteobacteria bacterium]|nr:hypothetical protein [Gammaproteobacteria bacterium]
MGSTKQAAMVSGPKFRAMRSKSSASSAPDSGWPLTKRFSGNQVCRMCAMPGRPGPKAWRFLIIPLNDTPAMLTPWYARSRDANRMRWPSPRV